MLRTLIPMLTLVAAIAIAGCDQVKISDEDVQSLREQRVAEAIAEPGTVLVDVRTPESYRAGHIQNAINIYLPDIRANDPRLADAKRIIVYGSGWSDPLSTAAAKRLMSLGYANVQEFKGGLEVWKSADYPIVKSPAPAQSRPETGS